LGAKIFFRFSAHFAPPPSAWPPHRLAWPLRLGGFAWLSAGRRLNGLCAWRLGFQFGGLARLCLAWGLGSMYAWRLSRLVLCGKENLMKYFQLPGRGPKLPTLLLYAGGR
jgi:hypothetical protein